jgi:hypothetical protein
MVMVQLILARVQGTRKISRFARNDIFGVAVTLHEDEILPNWHLVL